MNESSARDDGFTLIELLVVMIVIGILAAIAIPAFVSQKRKANETAAKSDVKQVVQEVITYYVDRSGPLTLSAGAGSTWQLKDSSSAVVAAGPLSKGNSVSSAGVIASDTSYCVAVQPSFAGANAWHASQNGLAAGDC